MEKVGLIPCAGGASRLGLPFAKEMFPNIHKSYYSPIIMYTIDAMQKAGVNLLIFTINPQKTDLLKFLGNGKKFGMEFTYCIHPEPRSLPESINEAYHLTKDKTVVFAMPDTYVQPGNFLDILITEHKSHLNRVVTLGCFPTNNPAKFGMVEFKDNLVQGIDDKPLVTNLKWMWGAMVWNPKFTEEINWFVATATENHATAKEIILTDALKPLINEKKVYCYCFKGGSYKDLGTYDEIREWAKESGSGFTL